MVTCGIKLVGVDVVGLGLFPLGAGLVCTPDGMYSEGALPVMGVEGLYGTDTGSTPGLMGGIAVMHHNYSELMIKSACACELTFLHWRQVAIKQPCFISFTDQTRGTGCCQMEEFNRQKYSICKNFRLRAKYNFTKHTR